MINVLLLRTPNENDDPYTSIFSDAGYNVLSVPVLETTLVNSAILEHIISTGPTDFNGVVFTSARSCDAWKQIVEKLTAERPSDITRIAFGDGDDNGKISREGTSMNWSDLPFYSVGPSTSSSLVSLACTLPHTPYTPHDIRGETTGSGERLAQFIVDQSPGLRPKRLLYLTGDKNRDGLTKILSEAGIGIEMVRVYETRGSDAFESHLEEVLYRESAATAATDWWIVHFAPSAAAHVTPILKKSFDFISGVNEPVLSHAVPSLRRARLAAIGPTTAHFLNNNLGLSVDVVAPKPTPRNLVDAILAYGGEQQI